MALIASSLALHGGPPAIPKGTIRPSPPISALDEEYVLKSLQSGSHAWGENCEALQREWVDWNNSRHRIPAFE